MEVNNEEQQLICHNIRQFDTNIKSNSSDIVAIVQAFNDIKKEIKQALKDCKEEDKNE